MAELSCSTSDSQQPKAAELSASRVPVTIVVPCFNEVDACDHLQRKLQELQTNLGRQYDFAFVFVDDGSSDSTYETLLATVGTLGNSQIVRHPANRGLGAALMTGIAHANTDVVCSMDFDCTYDPQQFSRMIPLLVDDVDVVTASPYHPDGEARNVPPWRLTLSKAASKMYSFLLRNQLHTYTSCFRVYRREAVADIRLRNEGFVGVVELLWEVDRRGGRIVECPASLGVRQYGQSKMRTAAVMLDHFKLMVAGMLRGG